MRSDCKAKTHLHPGPNVAFVLHKAPDVNAERAGHNCRDDKGRVGGTEPRVQSLGDRKRVPERARYASKRRGEHGPLPYRAS